MQRHLQVWQSQCGPRAEAAWVPCNPCCCPPMMNCFDFGEDPDPDASFFFRFYFKWFFTIERLNQKWLSLSVSLSLSRISFKKKLWTDSDEIWWTGWVFDMDGLFRFWWRSGYEIFKKLVRGRTCTKKTFKPRARNNNHNACQPERVPVPSLSSTCVAVRAKKKIFFQTTTQAVPSLS